MNRFTVLMSEGSIQIYFKLWTHKPRNIHIIHFLSSIIIHLTSSLLLQLGIDRYGFYSKSALCKAALIKQSKV